jgi:hypothetical protein
MKVLKIWKFPIIVLKGFIGVKFDSLFASQFVLFSGHASTMWSSNCIKTRIGTLNTTAEAT